MMRRCTQSEVNSASQPLSASGIGQLFAALKRRQALPPCGTEAAGPGSGTPSPALDIALLVAPANAAPDPSWQTAAPPDKGLWLNNGAIPFREWLSSTMTGEPKVG